MQVNILSVTEVVRNFSDYVNRVAYRREVFILRRGRQNIAELRPVPSGRRLGDLPAIIAGLPSLDEADLEAFSEDVSKSRSGLKKEVLRDPWAS